MSTITKKAVLANLALAHNQYIERIKAAGKPVLVFEPPCCSEQQETPAPPAGETWDSLTTCTACGSLFFKVVAAGSVSCDLVTSS